MSIPESQREIIQKIGTSVHSTEQAQEAQELGASYVTAGHIYATDCKKRDCSHGGLDFFDAKSVLQSIFRCMPSVGLNFDETQWMSLKECGAAGGCIMSGDDESIIICNFSLQVEAFAVFFIADRKVQGVIFFSVRQKLYVRPGLSQTSVFQMQEKISTRRRCRTTWKEGSHRW